MAEKALPWFWDAVVSGSVGFALNKLYEKVPNALSGSPQEEYNKGLDCKTRGEKECAAQHFLNAAHGDYSPAQLAIADAYFSGTGVTQNYADARKWYEAAANHQDTEAQYKLAEMYYKGLGMPKPSHPMAAEWLEKAANGGHNDAEAILGYLYEKGDVVNQDYVSSAYWYGRAAGGKYTSDISRMFAQVRLAGLLYAGHLTSQRGSDHNNEDARDLYAKAALAGNSYAQYCLAFLCENGIGGPMDIPCALKWYGLAKDNTDGQLDEKMREEAASKSVSLKPWWQQNLERPRIYRPPVNP